jgi:hypothetical protein
MRELSKSRCMPSVSTLNMPLERRNTVFVQALAAVLVLSRRGGKVPVHVVSSWLELLFRGTGFSYPTRRLTTFAEVARFCRLD